LGIELYFPKTPPGEIMRRGYPIIEADILAVGGGSAGSMAVTA